jgi:YHS domain-containing protein
MLAPSKFLHVLALAALAASSAALGQSKALPIALQGNDPVSYFSSSGPARGASGINYDFDDTRYLFANTKNKELFAANPDRYAPQFAGLCAIGLSMGMKMKADPSAYFVKDGKLYVFSSAERRDLAMKDPRLLEKAQQVWDQKRYH